MNLYSKMKKNPSNIHHWLYIIPTIVICYALALYASSTTNIIWYDDLIQSQTPSLRGAQRQSEILQDGPRINDIIERMRQVGVSSERQHQLQQHLTLENFATLSDRVLASAVNATHMDGNFTALGVIVYHGGYAVVNYDTLDMVYRIIDEAGGNYNELLNKYFKFISPGQREMIKERFINKKKKYTRQLVHRNLDEEKAYNQQRFNWFNRFYPFRLLSNAPAHPPTPHNNIDYGASKSELFLQSMAQLPPQRPSNLDEEKRLNQLVHSFEREYNIRNYDHRPVIIGMARTEGGSTSSIGKRKRSSSISSEGSSSDDISISYKNDSTLRGEKPDLAKPRDVRQLHITRALLDAYNEMDDNDQDLFRPVVEKYLPKLGVITDHNKLRRVYQNFRMEVYETLQKKGKQHLINMGDNLSDNHKLLMVKHFATEAEKHIKAGGDKLSKMDWEQSSCIGFVKHDMASSLFRQYQRDVNGKSEEESRQLWEDNEDDIMKAIGTVDFRVIISEDKDKFNTEIKEFIDHFNTSMEVINMIGSMNTSFHYLYYHLRTGEKMSSIIASTHLFNNVYGGEINTDAELVNVHGYIAHSECWLAGYIQNPINFDDALLSYFDSVINQAFAYVFGQVVSKEVLELEDNEELVLNTNMATRFGYGDLTPAEREKLAERLLKLRIKGGTTTGLIVNLARNIYKAINKQPSEMTVKDVTEQLESLKKQYNSKSNTDETEDSDVYKAFKELMEHNEKKLQDMSSLAKSISSVMQLGTIQILASKMFGGDEGQLRYGSDLQTITYKLESLYNNHKSKQKIDEGDVLALAFEDLIKQQPSITEDFSTLANFIYKVALSNSKTYQYHYNQMKNYINKYFFTMEGDTKKLVPEGQGGRGPVVYVTRKDEKEYPGLYGWWSTITGYKQYNGNIPGTYGVKAEKDTATRQELKRMGLKFDDELEDVSNAIKTAEQNRYDAKRIRNKQGGATKEKSRAFGKRS